VSVDDGIQAHAAWKIKLAAYIEYPRGRIESAALGVDDWRPPGRRLHGEANSGHGLNTEAVPGASSEFAIASGRVAKAIGVLQATMEQANFAALA
jgi:hypothetical protein